MRIIPIILIMFFFTQVFGQNIRVDIIEEKAGSLRIRMTSDQPALDIENGRVLLRYDNSQMIPDAEGRVVPFINKIISLNSEAMPVISISDEQWESIRIEQPPIYINTKPENGFIANPVEIFKIGNYRSEALYSLNIYPVWFLDQLSVKVLKSCIIELKYPVNGNLNSIKQNSLTREMSLNAQYFAQTDSKLVPSMPDQNATQIQNTDDWYGSEIKYKIHVRQAGIYKVTSDDLDAVDFPLNQVDPQKIRLINRGREIPIYFKGGQDHQFDEQDFFEFAGEPNEKTFIDLNPELYKDPFTDVNVYWLIVGSDNGRRIVEESGGLVETRPGTFLKPAYFKDVIHFEEDKYHENFGHTSSNLNRPGYEIDHWFFDSGISAVESRTYNFELPHPYGYGSHLFVKAAFRGKSYYKYPTNPLTGHELSIWLNDKKVDEITSDERWDGQRLQFLGNYDASGFSQSTVTDGVNSLRIDMEQTGVTDIVLLNWFDIVYARKYRSEKDYINFSIDQDYLDILYENPQFKTIQFEIDGFSDKNIQIYKNGISKIVNAQIDYHKDEQNYSSYRITFQDEIFDPDVEYIAVSESQKLKPESIVKSKNWNDEQPGLLLSDSGNEADYLIITNGLLVNNCSGLAELKEADGLKPAIVDVELIYDQFNHGIKSPLAIKDFIRYVFSNWGQTYPLKYVVLIGDASYDYKGVIRQSNDLVPTMLYETDTFGSAASDHWYSVLFTENDAIPDVIVSRIPAGSNDDLINYIDKVKNYSSTANNGPWRSKALFISGNDENDEPENLTQKPVFRTQNLRLMNMKSPQSIIPYRLNTVKDSDLSGFDPVFGSTTDLIDYFDDGLSFINFLGHGGGAIWADVQLLNLDDIDRLNNGAKLPFVASMTCFTGAFENPGKLGLAEKLVIAENRGAIAALASSGVGWTYNDFAIEWSLFDFLWNRGLTFGEAVNLMKINYLANPVYYTEEGSFYTWGYTSLTKSMVHQYNLLGDPALKMQEPNNHLSLSLNNYTPTGGENIVVKIAAAVSGKDGTVQVFNAKKHVILEQSFELLNNSAQVQFTLPSDLSVGDYTVVAYLNTQDFSASGKTSFSAENSIIRSVKTNPADLTVNQPFGISLAIYSPYQIEAVKLTDFKDDDRLYTYNITLPMQQTNDSTFQTIDSFPGFPSDGIKYFDVIVTEQGGFEHRYRWQKLTIYDPRPEFRVIENSIAFNGTNELQLDFTISNESDSSASGILLRVFDESGIQSQIDIFNETTDLLSHAQKKYSVPVQIDTLKSVFTFEIQIDSDGQFQEINENNNTIRKQVSLNLVPVDFSLGTSINFVENDTLRIDDLWNFYIGPGNLTASTLIELAAQDITAYIANQDQKDLDYIKIKNQTDESALWINIKNPVSKLISPAQLSADLDVQNYSPALISKAAFFRFDDFLGLWTKVPSQLHGAQLTAALTKSGLYAVFSFDDSKIPRIEITANGRPMIQNMLITSQPNIAILLQDENGVNFTESFSLKINDSELETTQISYPDTLRNPNSVAILATPQLEAGEHNLTVKVADINGNESTRETLFRVSDGFDLIVYGNYPNPFTDKTIISFDVINNNIIDDLKVKIYTISGRLIRSGVLELDETFPDDNILDVGYHELIWDGTDEDGFEVANGVYFATIEAKVKAKTIKRTLKIAKLK